MPIQYGGPGVSPSLGALVSNQLTLEAGQCWTVPSGRWLIQRGKYTAFQSYDPIANYWQTIGAGPVASDIVDLFSDGANYRLANQTGCAVGALITNAGSAYTSAPVVTATGAASGSLWRAIVGGAISTSITVTNGGVNYTYPPMVVIAAPPPGGIQATAHCTLASNAVTSVTVDNQGAGYAFPPIVTFINDPREGVNGVTQGYNAAAVTTLTGAGTITGLLCIDHGAPGTYSATTALPTLAFAGGGGSAAAATIIMDLSITAYAISTTTTGSGYVAPVLVSAYGGFPATASAYVNPMTQSLLVHGRAAQIVASILTGAFTATGQTVNDGGVYPGFPTMYVAASNVPGAGAVAVVFLNPTMGGQTDTSIVQPT